MNDTPAPTLPPFDLDVLTTGETATAERLSGQSIAVLDDPNLPSTMLKTALYFVWRKRFEPGFKWNDAQQVPLVEMFTALGLIETEDETDGADEPTDEDADPNPTGVSPRHA